jgi:hypothetical protein
MDRDEIAAKQKSSPYANSAQVDDADAPVLPGIAVAETGRFRLAATRKRGLPDSSGLHGFKPVP